ncbi:MAG: mannitol-1-phosphate 5-dehydrogenase [Mycetocola reblochoni]|uniref:Mannitol-1-phosphate 5-dehydrogenase n=2 Tax=Mycetocola reblochoni TaxID=331618 RepID=A0A1R4I9J4_9MICO|nr:mannitol-1-phosphate 5-dehydrogenase [Mycetocola reblochoni]RLP69169.1 mannitol-1-phosphate 5-dehydrogenase [Mycetocola reblochoni]SJN16274.1 Mannitol-1-phosphate 5-dehydrogenase [Mycetocola reblochoni REB411]
MLAVHFGAGNIGRGFIGLLLAEAGYEVVFADVNADMVDTINRLGGYAVHEVGQGAREHSVTGVRAVNSVTQGEELVELIARADVVTTAVGPSILPRIAPAIAAGILARPADAAPVWVMACENAVGASAQLAEAVAVEAGDRADEVARRSVFANTAVDRIVPAQDPDGADVTVEAFHEWTIERGDRTDAPEIPGAHPVDALGPYIERKLFTVNTGHATVAYLGYAAGVESIADAIAVPEIAARVEAVLAETSALLIAEHGFGAEALGDYRATVLQRFANRALPDTTVRVGRAPLRKLGAGERFIAPARRLADHGIEPTALLSIVPAVLAFDPAGDDEVEQLRRIRAELTPEAAVTRVTGVAEGEPLYAALVDAFRRADEADLPAD